MKIEYNNLYTHFVFTTEYDGFYQQTIVKKKMRRNEVMRFDCAGYNFYYGGCFVGKLGENEVF